MSSAAPRGRVFGALLGVLAVAMAAEAVAHLYVNAVARQGKLFTADDRLGWRVLPGLDRIRRNADGADWRVTTDAEGWRLPIRFRPEAARRVLVLGDSFAFGQGVGIEERFDSILELAAPEVSVVNLGVMGYGLDQELIGARGSLGGLRKGDWLVFLAHGGDFWDLMRRHHAGRAKPWFELAGGTLVEHAPAITWHERVRDHSYLLSAAAQAMEARLPRPPPREFEPARDLYRALLLQEATPLLNRGVSVLLAHHDDHPEGPAFDVRAFFDELCKARFRCLALDDALGSSPGKTRQSDGHWNAAGHRAVAKALGEVLAP